MCMSIKDLLSKTMVDKLNDRDIMWFLATVRSNVFDIDQMRNIVQDRIPSYYPARNVFLQMLHEFEESIEGMEEEMTHFYDALDLTIISEEGYYPVLFRGKEKTFEWIDLSLIDCDRLPLNEDGFKTAQLVHGFIPIPPVKLITIEGGRYRLQDGRHRFLAFKLNGQEKIPAIVHKDFDHRKSKFTEALHVTGREYKEVLKKLA